MAAGKSGSFVKSFTYFDVRVTWEETYDISGNYSVLSITKLELRSGTYGGTFYPGGTVKANGTAVLTMDYHGTATHSTYINAGTVYGTITPVSGSGGTAAPWTSGQIVHSSDGTGSAAIALELELYRSSDGRTFTLGTATETITLTTIPRASTASFGSFTIGKAGTITVSRASASFTHNISVVLGGTTYSIATGVGASYTWTPALATWAPRITTAKRADCTMIVETYSGSTKIGSYEGSFTLYVPSLPPVLSSGFAAAAYYNTGTDAANIKAFVQGYSKAQVTFSASKIAAQYGASITGYKITCNGSTDSASPYLTPVLTGTSETITCTVTDSRGYSSTGTLTVSLYAYAKPTLSGISIYRADSDGTANDSGTCIYVKATLKYSSIGGLNSCPLYAYYKLQTSGSYGSATALTSGAGKILTSGAAVTSSYTVKLSATDSLGNPATYIDVVPTEAVTLVGRDGGNGLGFGMYNQHEGGVDSAYDLYLYGKTIYDENGSALFAPSGYGLGETSGKWTNDPNQAINPGFWVLGGDDCINYPSLYSLLRYGTLLVERRLNSVYQTVRYGNVRALRYSDDAGSAWSDWQYDNPPMEAGIEYPTTERHNGKTVYAKRISCGDAPSNGAKNIKHGLAATAIVRISANNGNGTAIPYVNSTGGQILITADVNYIVLYTNYASTSTGIYADVYYTKT